MSRPITIKNAHREVMTLKQTGPVRLDYAPGAGRDLVISFASIGQKRTLMPNNEFLGTLMQDTERHCLFISDISRSWLNGSQPRQIIEREVCDLLNSAGISRVTTLGLSMGGFSALVASDLFPVDTAIAFSPQFSPSKQIMPSERRWRYWTKQITELRAPTAVANVVPGHSFVFHGLIDDLHHVNAFPTAPHRDHHVFPETTHSDLAIGLKKAGLLNKIIEACIARDRRRVARLVRQGKGRWRRPNESLTAHAN